jgi:hypothetical protein
MPSVTVHYDGWVQLPERMRKALRLDTGAQLEAELVDGGLLLRAAGAVGKHETKEASAAEAMSAEAPGGMAPAGEVPAIPEQEDVFGSAEPTPTRPRSRGRPKASPA